MDVKVVMFVTVALVVRGVIVVRDDNGTNTKLRGHTTLCGASSQGNWTRLSIKGRVVGSMADIRVRMSGRQSFAKGGAGDGFCMEHGCASRRGKRLAEPLSPTGSRLELNPRGREECLHGMVTACCISTARC